MGVTDLESFGMHWMDENDIRQTLANQRAGVLGVVVEGRPFLRPLSYWFDESNDALYFLYVLGDDSEKAKMSDATEIAQFLVYTVETTFNWRSVLVTGSIERVPSAERSAVDDRMEIEWAPDLFERAAQSQTTALYRLDIEEQSGIKQLELPPELRDPSTESRME